MARPTRTGTVYFGLGLTCGLVIAFVVTSHLYPAVIVSFAVTRRNGEIVNNRKWTVEDGLEKEYHFGDEHLHRDDDHVAKYLSEKVRVLCWVMTSPEYLQKKAIHVRATWGKRCNKLLFMSSTTNSSFPTIGLNASEEIGNFADNTTKAFRYIAEHHMDEADWFMEADDQTYIILENLRYFLSKAKADAPVYYGSPFKTVFVGNKGYYSGGGGYVLSKEAMRRFREQRPEVCRRYGRPKDEEMVGCMRILGITTSHFLDTFGRTLFHGFDVDSHLFGGFPGWYYPYEVPEAKKGLGSISDYAITFHHVTPRRMYALEFFIYHLKPFGLMSHSQNPDVGLNASSSAR